MGPLLCGASGGRGPLALLLVLTFGEIEMSWGTIVIIAIIWEVVAFVVCAIVYGGSMKDDDDGF